VHAVQWSTSDEFILATGGADGTVRVWDIRRTHTCRSMLNQDGPAVQLQGSGNDRKRQRQEASSGVVPQVCATN
jgi:DNA excision repair protein ERCC-8